MPLPGPALSSQAPSGKGSGYLIPEVEALQSHNPLAANSPLITLPVTSHVNFPMQQDQALFVPPSNSMYEFSISMPAPQGIWGANSTPHMYMPFQHRSINQQMTGQAFLQVSPM